MKFKNRSENLYWIWLSESLGAGNKYLSRLVRFFGSSFDIYNSTEEEIIRSEAANEQIARKLADKSLKRAYQILDYCSVNNVGILSYGDKNYPERLRMLQDPPAVLYYKGTLPDFDQRLCIGVVGTRTMSEYGKRAGYKLAYELASAGAVVVSGMALGVDSVAACGAMVADGATVAVLGSGIDVVYPPQHKKLQRVIEERGVVLTEYAPGTKPYGSNFPMRNRIISGLCQGTLVIEADEGSGALLTARNALMQGRGVFALPGNIDRDTSSGTNGLIKDGARFVTCAEDILSNYELIYGKSLNYSALTFARQIFNIDSCDEALGKLGIAFRENRKAVPIEDDSSRLRPTRRPTVPKDSSRPTTNKAAQQKKAPIIPQKLQSDGSEKILASLDEETRAIFLDIPIDRAITVDQICKMGHDPSEVISALTMLEMKGLISALPGNIYVRR